MSSLIPVMIGVWLGFMVLIVAFYAARIKKVGPNEVMVISGRSAPDASQDSVNFRVVSGGRSFIWPIVERVDYLSLEVMLIQFTVETHDKAQQVVELTVVAQVKVAQDWDAIRKAAVQLLSKSPAEIAQIARERLERQVYALSETLTVEEIKSSKVAFAEQLQEDARESLDQLGIVIDSCLVRQAK
jgi:flotillin